MTSLNVALAHSLPEAILALGALVLVLFGAYRGRDDDGPMSEIAIGVIGVAILVILLGNKQSDVVFNDAFINDGFARFMKVLALIGSMFTLVLAQDFMARARIDKFEFPILVLLSTLGMCMMISANGLIALYLGLELMSLALYVVAAFHRDNLRASEAGLKYFVLGALSSGMLLYGASLLYGFTGTVSFAGIAKAINGHASLGVVFALVFIMAGLAFKMSTVPFHMWTPDVYEGSPTPVTMFFATAPKVAALGLTMRLALFAFGTQTLAWQQIVMALALLSIVIGALGAIGQGNIKRLLAYSSINNVGFMLVGLAAATPAGAAAMLTYLAIYVVTSVAGFVAVLMLKDENGAPVEAIADLAGLSSQRKVLSACLAMVMFSLAGIPPLFGFWGKFVVFQAAVAAGQVVLATVAVAASVISAFYYLKVVKVLYFDEPAGKALGRSDWVHQALLLAAALAISPLGYLATRALAGWTQAAAAALFHAA